MRANYLRYTAILLVIVFFVAAAFLFLEVWESDEGRFSGTSTGNDVIEYKGKEYVKKDDVETLLVLGLDKYKGADSAESHKSGVQADFLMLFVFDKEDKECTAIQINRDTMTKVNKLAVGGATVAETFTKQIALAYNYADASNDKIKCRNTKDSVEYLFKGLTVDHYLSLTMDAVAKSCDLVGGVEVTVLDDFTGIDNTLIKGERVNLTGEQALRYVRSRYGLEDSTNHTRMVRQQQYIEALYKKIDYCMEADEEFIVSFIDGVDDYVVYDSSDQKMLKYAQMFEEYKFLGIREIEGQTKLGEEFIEFYPDEESIMDISIGLFYKQKAD